MVIALFPPGLEPTGVSTSTESMWVCCVTPRTWRSVLSKEQCSRVQSVNRGLEGNMLSISIYFLSFVCKYLHTKCLKMRFRLIICLFSNVLAQEIEKSHNQNRKTKDGTTDSNKGKKNPYLHQETGGGTDDILWYGNQSISHLIQLTSQNPKIFS